MSPLVSILLPFWNAEPFLEAALESVRNQTCRDWEAVLVDDGSTDSSAEIAARFVAGDPRFRLVSRPHAGLVSALRTACGEAAGAFWARMDADDVCLPRRLEKQVAALKADPDLGVVSTRVEFGGDPAAQAGYAAYVDWTQGILTPGDHARYRFVESPVAHPSVMWRREVMERHGGYRELAGPEDYELWLRWMDAGVRFRKLKTPGLVWKDPPDRLSRTGEAYRTEAFYQVKCRYLARVLPPGRPVWLWGSGRSARTRFASLERLRGPFAGFIDVDPRKIGQRIHGRRVVEPAQLPADAFVLTGVASRGAREKMEAWLMETGRRWGRDYWLCA